MDNYEKYRIDSKIFINDKILIYLLTLNGFFVIIAFSFIVFWNLSLIPYIFTIIVFVTLNILINYFVITKSKFLDKNFSLVKNEFIDEDEEYKTIMK